MGLKTHTYLFIISLLFTSCELLLGKDDELTIKREEYNGNQLKINGYYYKQLNDSIILPRFLNKNGTLSTPGSMKINKKYNYEDKFSDLKFRERVKNIKFFLGGV